MDGVAVVDGNEPPPLSVRLKGTMMNAPVPADVICIRNWVQLATGSCRRPVLAPVFSKIDYLVEVVDEDSLLLTACLVKGEKCILMMTSLIKVGTLFCLYTAGHWDLASK